MNVLVTGGAGYIGAHVVRLLLEQGDTPVVVDDLSRGLRARVLDAPFEHLDLLQPDAHAELARIIREHSVSSVIHFAALKAAGESMQQPIRYWSHNMGSLITVLDGMVDAGVSSIVFSSSAAVYGDGAPPLTEAANPAPLNPYGETKLAGEWLINAAVKAHGLSAISLRYFNVAGAASPELGDTSANNLIPMVIERLDTGQPPLIFGDDYETRDGTCIRDYIHVTDVAEAHIAALNALTPGHRVYNVGTGSGSSVREVIDLILEVSELDVRPEIAPRRPGDPDTVVAGVERIRDELGWTARHTTRDAVVSAWRAHVARPTPST